MKAKKEEDNIKGKEVEMKKEENGNNEKEKETQSEPPKLDHVKNEPPLKKQRVE